MLCRVLLVFLLAHGSEARHSHKNSFNNPHLHVTHHAQQRMQERGYTKKEQAAVVRGERAEACVSPAGSVVTVYPKGNPCSFKG